MLQVILLILKIIGILLLSILGLVLLILALVLFVPFRYDVKGDVQVPPEDTGQEQAIEVVARVHWLLRLIGVQIEFSKAEGLKKKLRIFFIPISLDKKAAKEDASADAVVAENSEQTEGITEGETAEVVSEATVESAETSGADSKEEAEVLEGIAGDATVQGDDTVSQAESEGSTIDAEVQDTELGSEDGTEGTEEPAEKVGFVQKIKNKIAGLKAKIEELKDMAMCMLELFNRKKGLAVAYIKKDNTQAAIKAVLTTLWKIIKHILPRKYEGEVTFGSGDPEMTGKIFAAAAVFYPVYESHLAVYPDMENKVVYVKGSFSGRIRLWSIVFPAIKLLLNKNVRRVLKEAMHVKDEMMQTPDEIKEIVKKAA